MPSSIVVSRTFPHWKLHFESTKFTIVTMVMALAWIRASNEQMGQFWSRSRLQEAGFQGNGYWGTFCSVIFFKPTDHHLDYDEDYHPAMSKWAGPDYRGRWALLIFMYLFIKVISIYRGAFFAWRAPILSWPRIMCSQVRMLKFLEPSREMP